MESNNTGAERPQRDLRFFTKDAYEIVDLGDDAEPLLHVNDLVGADGERLQPNDEDLEFFRSQPDAPEVEPTMDATIDSVLFGTSDVFSAEWTEEGARFILEQLIERKAPAANLAFKEATLQLIEPVRSVAVAYFYCSSGSEVERAERTARKLRTSVETVEFLVQVALMYLEPMIEIRPAYVRSKSERELEGPVDDMMRDGSPVKRPSR